MSVAVKLIFASSQALLSCAQYAGGPKSGSCWTVGFTFEHCCAPEYGAEGNAECWDDVYTYDACCSTQGSDPAEAGCGSHYFSRFRQLAGDYYSTGRVRPALIDLFPRVLGNFEARFRLCAPAALQAMLLQIEERSALEPPEATADRALAYALRAQHALEEGLLTAPEARAWPLEPGLERLREANRLRRPRPRGRRPPELALVLSYCREELRWMNSTLSPAVVRRVDLVVVQKCPGVDGTRAVPRRRQWRSVTVLDVEDMPVRADECSAYLGYLSQEYERLPRHMLFVHADAPEHIGGFERPNIIDDTLRALLQGTDVPFAHLGSNRVTMAWNPETMSVLWRGLFGSNVVPGASEVRTYCCSHFVVSRERVLLRPRRFYERALRFVMSPESYSYLPVAKGYASATDIRTRLVCQNMMFVWHVMFGENLDLPHRMFDPQLPFFLKVRNIRTAYMDL